MHRAKAKRNKIRYLNIVLFNLKVYMSGCEVGRFQHRISLERVIALSVEGDVSLTNVVFTEVSVPPLLQTTLIKFHIN